MKLLIVGLGSMGKRRARLIRGVEPSAALAGSPYLPDFKGKILFLEDVSEAPYRVDRMMSTLKLMGALDAIAGFVFGECTDCNPGDGYGSLTLEQILDDYIKPLKIPAYRGAMIGHLREQFILPVGGVHVSASMRRHLRRCGWRVALNSCFCGVP